ncbi:phosphatase PAP2 family protein [Terracoccus sp. 273MFTsu3.1]|uniref:phosphatase PAP2 family protein n=1 Tax=Terracoccus sp. 273MFTsu3.1 TaxID=1172188 RepID=UPI00037FB492|nr:phosphatase PAP2 family protein [Terracoccus sp. 273MFTsu3.1]
MTTVVTSEPDTTRRRRPRRVWVVSGIALLVVGLALGFAVTAVGASRTGELGLDVLISGHRDRLLTVAAELVDVGLGTRIAPVLLRVGCGVVWTRDRFAAVTIGVLTVVGWLSVEVGKVLVHRPRPPAAAVHALVAETAADSYPSGHTAFAAATVFAVVAALVLTGRSTRVAWAVGLPVVAVVALSRLYLGVHYLADVAASVVFAGASVLVVTALAVPALPWLRLRMRSRLRPRAGEAERRDA